MGTIIDQPFSVYASTGFGASAPSAPTGTQPAVASSAGPGINSLSAQGLLSLRNPVSWFGIFAAVTFGLIAVSSTVRVGKAKAKATIGKE